MDSNEKINGGYYIKARKIQESEIAHWPPHVREIWDWLLKEANHTDNKCNGIIIKRGQCFRSYKDIQEGLHWYAGWKKMMYSKWDCEKAMKKLVRATMIATTRTTRGLFITICNYDLYQNPNNYMSHTRATIRATNEPHSGHSINNNDNNEKNKKEYISAKFPTEIHLLFDLFCLSLPKALLPKQPIRDTWLETLDKLHRIDGFSYFQITDMIDWFRQDEFWSKNFLTPLKLRRLNKEKQQYAQVFWQKLLDEKFEDGPADSGAETAVEYIKHKMEEWESK